MTLPDTHKAITEEIHGLLAHVDERQHDWRVHRSVESTVRIAKRLFISKQELIDQIADAYDITPSG